MHVKTACVWAGVEAVAVAVCKVSHTSILALILHLEPSKGTGCLFGRWIQSLIQVAHPEQMYLLVMVQAQSWWPLAQQKMHVSGQGPNWKKGVGAAALTVGVTGVGMGAAAGALHIGSGGGSA